MVFAEHQAAHCGGLCSAVFDEIAYGSFQVTVMSPQSLPRSLEFEITQLHDQGELEIPSGFRQPHTRLRWIESGQGGEYAFRAISQLGALGLQVDHQIEQDESE